MAFKSSFGTALPATDFVGPPPPKPKKHGILTNLLTDAIDTARGLPFGMYQFAKDPIKSVKMMGESYADTYGQGWGHFKQEFMAHPLQPLLDAISIPLIAAGGVGFGVKSAAVAANAGRSATARTLLAESSRAIAKGDFKRGEALRAEYMKELPAPRLEAAAQHFRRGTTATVAKIPVATMPGVSLPHAFSANLFRRALQRGSMAVMDGMYSKAGLSGRGERMLAKETRGKRPAATASAAKAEAAFLVDARKGHEAGKAGFEPQRAADMLADHFEFALKQGALRVDAKHLPALARSEKVTGPKAEYQFIYGTKPVEAFAEKRSTFTVSPGGEVTPSPFVAHPAKASVADTRNVGLKSYDNDTLLTFIKTELPSRVRTGSNPTKALVEGDSVFLVRKGHAEDYIKEIENTAKLAAKIYHAPLSAWKGIILGLSPRYLVNNVIGNMAMYMAATNPVELTRGVIEGTRSARGNRAAARLERQMEDTLDALMKKHLPDDWIYNRAGYLQHGALGVEQTAGIRVKNPVKRAAHARLYTVTEKVSYRAPQRAALQGAMHSDPDFRNLYRENVRNGMERRAAYEDAANTIWSDPLKAAGMEKRVTDWAGQYYHLNSLEKKITAFVPFYTWDRHALRFGKEQVLSRPVSSMVLASMGALGDEQAEKELGKLPDFMKGAVPLPGGKSGVLGFLLGQNIVGRKKIALTAGYNPLAASVDNANAILAMFGKGPRPASESVGGQLNPVISGFISGVTGQRLFSGAKAVGTEGLGSGPLHVPIGGPVGSAIHETFGELPHAKLIKHILGQSPPTTTNKGEPTLYEKGMRQTLSSILGLNERDFSPEAARRLYDKEQGVKKGRRRKKKDAAGAASSLKSNLKSNF